MPKNKKQGILMSAIMSLLMIYIMAALNMNVRMGDFTAEVWIIALKRLPLGFLTGIICDLLICTPLSRKIVEKICSAEDKEIFKTFTLRFCMVIFMTVAMTIFYAVVSGKTGMEGISDFFKYLPYNFTIALPIQMLIIAPCALKLAGFIAPEKSEVV